MTSIEIVRVLLAFSITSLVSCETASFGKIGMLVRLHGATGKRLGPSWDRIAGSGLMAMHHVNHRVSSLVPQASSLIPEGFRLEYELADTNSDAREGIEIALEWVKSNVQAIVGPYRSAVSGPVALVADTAHLPVLSWGSTSTALSDTTSYRTFGRTIPSDAVPALGIVRMCKDFGWSKIAMLFIDDAYGRGYAQDIATFAGQHGIEVATSQKFFGGNEGSVESAVANVKKSLARIIVCIAFEIDMDQIVFSAARHEIIREGYVWITTDAIASPQDVAFNSNNPPEMARLLSGWFRISVGPFVGRLGERFQAAWKSEPAENKQHPLLSDDASIYEDECSEFCGFVYDAVWAMAIAMSRTETASDQSMDGLDILTKLRELQFEGATGSVFFDEAGDRDPSSVPIVLKNFVAVWADDGSLEAMTDDVVWTWDMAEGLTQISGQAPTWPGGNVTWTAPQDGAACPPGFEYSAVSLACRPCAPGHELRNGTCQACPVGSVAPLEAMPQCIPCSDGYAPRSGMSRCTPCPPNSQRKPNTPGESPFECECSPGYYANNGPGQGCAVCITGGICEGGAMAPYPEGWQMEGFWGDRECQQFNGTKDCPLWDKFVICNPNWNCLGGKDFLCEQGRKGNICQQAKDGFFIVGGSFWNACGVHGSGLTTLYILVVVVFWFVVNHFASQKYHALNIALLFVQVCAIVGMFNMKWPANLDHLNIALSVANFDVDFVTPHCLGKWSLVASFYLQLALPFVFGVARSCFMFAREFVQRRLRGAKGRVTMHSSSKQIMRDPHEAATQLHVELLTGSVQMSFVVTMYATLCIKCFQVFRCERYPDGNLYVWFAPEIQCWQPNHVAMVVTASLYIPIVLIGTPIFIFWVIRTHQREGRLHCAKAVRRWAWVHDAFEAKYKYWEVLLITRRFAIALIAGVVVEPMVQGALSIIVLTGLLAAHVFTKPYIRDDIDVMDFCSIVATILYVLAGLLIFPNATEKAQGRVCASDAFLRDEAEYCSGEDGLKAVISVVALAIVIVTLLFSFAVTARQIRMSYLSQAASRVVLELCKTVGQEGEDAEHSGNTLNQVELDEILHGTWLHAWAARIRSRAECAHSSQLLSGSALDLRLPDTPASRTLVGSPESFYRINGAIRDLDEDITESSAQPLAMILRKLCKVPGIIEYLAWKGPQERASLLHFVKEMAHFESLAEHEQDPFPLTHLVVEEHRPIVAYFLMTCSPSLIHKFYHLTDAILESNGHQPRTQRHVLRVEERKGSAAESLRSRSTASPAFGASFANLGSAIRKSVLGGSTPRSDREQRLDSVFLGRTHTSPAANQSDSFRSFRARPVEGGNASPLLASSNRELFLPSSDMGLERTMAWLPAPDGRQADKYAPVLTSMKRKMMPKLIRRSGDGSEYCSGEGVKRSASSTTSASGDLSSLSRDLTSLQSQTTEASREEEAYTEQWLGVLEANQEAEESYRGVRERGPELEDIAECEETVESINRSGSRLSSSHSSRPPPASSTPSKRCLAVDDADQDGFIRLPPHPFLPASYSEWHAPGPEEPEADSSRSHESPYPAIHVNGHAPPHRPAGWAENDGESLEIVLEAPTTTMTQTGHVGSHPANLPSVADRFLRMPATPPPVWSRGQDRGQMVAQGVTLTSALVHHDAYEREDSGESCFGPLSPPPLSDPELSDMRLRVSTEPLAWDASSSLASWA